MPFYVRNKLKTTHLFTPVDGPAIAWKPAGDPDGGDIAYVSDDIKADIGYIQAVRRGSLEEVSEEEALSALDAQDEAAVTRTAENQLETASVINRVQDRSITGTTCVGPAAGGKPCGAAVTQTKAEVGEKPPLCNNHKALELQYVPVEGTDRDERTGKVETSWQRVSVKK